MQDYLSANKFAYNHLADEYSRRVNEYKKKDIDLMATFIQNIKSKNNHASLLELGPGSGLALQIFQDNGFLTTAIDIADNIIQVAKKASPTTIFINDDFLHYDFGNKKYDAICAKAFLHLFPKHDAQKVINKISSLLAKGGFLFVATTIHELPSEGYETKADYENSPKRYRKKWTEIELISEFSHNWRIIEKNYNTDRSKHWIALTLEKI